MKARFKLLLVVAVVLGLIGSVYYGKERFQEDSDRDTKITNLTTNISIRDGTIRELELKVESLQRDKQVLETKNKELTVQVTKLEEANLWFVDRFISSLLAEVEESPKEQTGTKEEEKP